MGDDITFAMLRFREAVRHAWNTYFEGSDAAMGPTIQDAFSMIEQGFFNGIVLGTCGEDIAQSRYRHSPVPRIVVVPRPEMSDLALQMGPRGSGAGAWDPPSRVDASAGLTLEFVGFFDWNPYGSIDQSLVRVHISRMDARPDAVGRHALADVQEVHFQLVDAQEARSEDQTI